MRKIVYTTGLVVERMPPTGDASIGKTATFPLLWPCHYSVGKGVALLLYRLRAEVENLKCILGGGEQNVTELA